MKEVAIIIVLVSWGTFPIHSQTEENDSEIYIERVEIKFNDDDNEPPFSEVYIPPDRSWETQEDHSHLQGKLMEIWGPNGQKYFMGFYYAAGNGNGFNLNFNKIHKDSVISYYRNHLKLMEFDSITYKSRTTIRDDEWREWTGVSYSFGEFYSFWKNGERFAEISIGWEEKWFRSWTEEIFNPIYAIGFVMRL
jgi:hypothetical protein